MPWFGKKKETNAPVTQTPPSGSAAPEAHPLPAEPREPDAIYQLGKIVARVTDSEVDLEAREIRFGEIYQSDLLLLPEECEFREYKILVQRIAFATKAEPVAIQKGRSLKGVIAEILGYREQ